MSGAWGMQEGRFLDLEVGECEAVVTVPPRDVVGRGQGGVLSGVLHVLVERVAELALKRRPNPALADPLEPVDLVHADGAVEEELDERLGCLGAEIVRVVLRRDPLEDVGHDGALGWIFFCHPDVSRKDGFVRPHNASV
jgi:hypothetical protein